MTTTSDPPVDAGVATADAGIQSPDAGGAPAPAPITELADPWLGLTRAEVLAWVRSKSAELGHDRGVHIRGGARKLTVKGNVWVVEWLPSGCSDWYSTIELRFARDRVVSTKLNRSARYSGIHC